MASENTMEEGNLVFDFTRCGNPIKFDEHNNSGLYAVDFFVDREKYLLFLEVKDYQNPNTPRDQQNDDYKMLISAGIDKESIFTIQMVCKIKDSLLNLYAKGYVFTKNVVYILFINFDDLKADERRQLFEKISRQIPTGLNNDLFIAFKKINFKLVDAKELKKYGIICTRKSICS